MEKIIGINLGTTNSVVAVMEDGKPTIIPSAEGERLMPSVVAVNKNHELLVGRIARNQAVVNPENTIFSIKRFMGRRYDDPEVQKAITRVPYEVIAAQNGDVLVILDGKEYSPTEISAMILKKIKADAEAYLGEPVTQAVITVPAYFNDAQRNATKDAGRIAGLEVLRIINEPTASALAYGLDKNKDEVIAVYDLGGGIFDISIVIVGRGVFQVRSTSGDTFLGGDDFDQRIIDYIADEFKKEHGIDLRQDRHALQRLKEAAEKAKIELSSLIQTEINLPYITADPSGPKHITMTLNRAKLEQLTQDLIEHTLDYVRKELKDDGLEPHQIDEVVLVGGMTHMPAVQEAIRTLFGKESHKGVNPDEVVAVGAAIQAGMLTGEVKDIHLYDVTPLTLCIETLGGVATPMIDRNTTIPTRKSQIFSTASDNQSQVEIHVLQGERPMAADNKSLGKFILDGIPPAPRGVPQIEVTFDIDANGILKVTAFDKVSGRNQNITITASSGLSEVEVERMRKKAESYLEEDRRRKELIEARNMADNAVYNAEKALQDLGDKVPMEIKTKVEEQVSKVRNAMNTDNTQEIKPETEALFQVIQQIGAAVYQSSGSQGRSPSAEEDQAVGESKCGEEEKEEKSGSLIPLNFGYIKKYYQRGFGYVSQELSSSQNQLGIYFHIKTIKRKYPELGINIDNNPWHDVSFWYVTKQNFKGEEVSEIWLTTSELPKDLRSEALSLIESYWNNLDSKLPDWLVKVTVDLIGEEKLIEWKENRNRRIFEQKQAEEKRREEERKRAEEEHKKREAERLERLRAEQKLVAEKERMEKEVKHQKIEAFSYKRGITTIIHFTQATNLPNILRYGLLCRKSLEEREINYVFNDRARIDKHTEAICTSISYPNYKMLYKYITNDPLINWAVILLDASLLWKLDCAFCQHNAASNEVTRIPLQERKMFSALELMFNDLPKRQKLQLPDNYPTNPQAEVLVFEPIPIEYIQEVHLKQNSEELIAELKNINPNVIVKYDNKYFNPRFDYEHW